MYAQEVYQGTRLIYNRPTVVKPTPAILLVYHCFMEKLRFWSKQFRSEIIYFRKNLWSK